MSRKPSQYVERTACIVAMTARYETVIAAAVSKVLFGGVKFQSGNVLNSESHAGGPLQAHPRSLPGGMTRWTLSAKGAERAGLARGRVNSGAVDLDLGILFACVFGDDFGRHRLMHDEFRQLIGDQAAPSNVPHMISAVEGTTPRIYRVYQATRDVQYTLKRLRDIRDKTMTNPSLSNWVRDGDYGICCLVPTSQQLATFGRIIEGDSLARSIPITVALGPTAETLASELRKRK